MVNFIYQPGKRVLISDVKNPGAFACPLISRSSKIILRICWGDTGAILS